MESHGGEPASYLTLREGTPVRSADGEEVGRVEHVLADEETDIFDGLVIDTPGLGGRRFADADQVADITTDAVTLTLSAAEAEALPEPSANPAALEHEGGDLDSPLQAKLRRAWDLISGNY